MPSNSLVTQTPPVRRPSPSGRFRSEWPRPPSWSPGRCARRCRPRCSPSRRRRHQRQSRWVAADRNRHDDVPRLGVDAHDPVGGAVVAQSVPSPEASSVAAISRDLRGMPVVGIVLVIVSSAVFATQTAPPAYAIPAGRLPTGSPSRPCWSRVDPRDGAVEAVGHPYGVVADVIPSGVLPTWDRLDDSVRASRSATRCCRRRS